MSDILEKYNGVIRLVAFVTGFGMWTMGIRFSADGFNVKWPDMIWIGYLMGIFITVIELVFNRAGFGHNLTLILAGIFAYGYGLWTNFIGIVNLQGGTVGLNESIVLPIFFSALLEFVPEPFILYALLGQNNEDPLSRIINGMVSLFGKGGGQPRVPPSPFRSTPPFGKPGGSTPPTDLSFLTRPPRGEKRD